MKGSGFLLSVNVSLAAPWFSKEKFFFLLLGTKVIAFFPVGDAR